MIQLPKLIIPLVIVLLSACRPVAPQELPTVIPSVDALATAVVLTENAPPPGYREPISFERVDRNLRELEGWRYTLSFDFDGVFAQTGRETSAQTTATVWFNQISGAQRVMVESVGELLQRAEPEAFEAVQLGDDVFLIRRGSCLVNVEADARAAAGIAAGDLIGGARDAYPVGRRAMVNGQQAWEYHFELDDLNLPSVRFVEDTRVTRMTGEMWIAPETDTVVRYWVTLDIENARLLLNDLPVTGQLRLRYDLHDVGELPNISVPFGC